MPWNTIGFSNAGRFSHFRIGLSKFRAQGPVVEVPEMSLEDRVDKQVV